MSIEKDIDKLAAQITKDAIASKDPSDRVDALKVLTRLYEAREKHRKSKPDEEDATGPSFDRFREDIDAAPKRRM